MNSTKVLLYGYSKLSNGLNGNGVCDELYDEEYELDFRMYRIKSVITYVEQFTIAKLKNANFFIDNVLCTPNDTLSAGSTLHIVRPGFRRYQIIFQSYGKMSQATAKDEETAKDILDTYIHLYQMGRIEALDWRGTPIETLNSVKRPPVNFLRRKRPCEAYRDFNIDLSGQRKFAGLQMQHISHQIQELKELREYAKKRREHQKRYNSLILESILEDESDEPDEPDLTQKIAEFLRNDSQNEFVI